MNIIERIFSGSATPCNDLLAAIDSGEITEREANAEIVRRYGDRVRCVGEGAAMESAHMRELDC